MKSKVVIIDEQIQSLEKIYDIINNINFLECTKFNIKSRFNLRELDKLDFDIILYSIEMYNIHEGGDIIAKLKNKYPEKDIIIISSIIEEQFIVRAFTMGATGFIFNSSKLSNLENDLKLLVQGGAALSPIIAKKLVKYFNGKTQTTQKLKIKEQQILLYLVDGKTYDEIAEALSIKIDNVRYYIKSIYKKFQVNNRSSAIQKYYMSLANY